jgi:hypothetical protein
MDRKPLLKKGLAVGIILLFVGTCIIPSTGDFTVSKGIKKVSHDICTNGDSPPDEEWNRTYRIPSKGDAIGNCVQVTPDGGYIVTGYAGYGYWYDVYVLKVDSQGNELWNRTFGNQSTERYDGGKWVEVTSDNGYIITGDNCRIYSNGVTSQTFLTGDSNPINDITASPTKNRRDQQIYGFDNMYPVHPVWFDPTDPETLHVIGDSSANDYICAGTWAHEKWYVSAYYGGLYTVDPTTGEMTLIGGSTQLNGLGYVDTSAIMYGCDNTNLYTVDRNSGETTFIGPMNNAGVMIDMAVNWNGIAYGIDSVDNNLYSIDLSTGATTIIGPTGVSCEYAGMVYDKEYDVLYLAAYAGVGKFYTVDVTTGHATLVGTFENGDEVEGLAIPHDGVFYQYDKKVWLIKTDANGNEEWNKTFSFGQGYGHASGTCVKQTKDGGYIITGNDAGRLLLIKTNGVGNELWNKTYYNDSYGSSLALTTDGGYVVTGGLTTGKLLLMKTNETGVVEWEREYFNAPWPGSCGEAVQQASDGGYIVGGYNSSEQWPTDMLLLKTDENGNEEWNRTFGTHGYGSWDFGYSVLQTSDGDYVIGGTQLGLEHVWPDKFWLIRTHPDGSVVWDQCYMPSLSAQCYCVQQTPDNGFIATGVVNRDRCVILKISGGNHPPDSSTIEGSHWGVINEDYLFCINATDPDGDAIYCKWEWGDGNITDWLGPYSSNETVCASHAWSQKGTYEIRVKLKDKFGHESNWSDPYVFNVYELKNAFLFGRYTNMTTEGDYSTVEAVNLRMILFRPLQYFHYIAGEKITFLKNNSKALITPRFIIGMVDAVI